MDTLETASNRTTGLTRSYLLNKLFSLFGIILGVYAVIHLYGNLTAIQGPEAFNEHLVRARQGALTGPILILLIWLPILFHGIYGMMKLKQARPNNVRFNYWENLKYITQRLSGIGIFLFIPAHMIKSKIIPTYIDGVPADFNHMVEGFAEPLTVIVYLLGTLGVAYHVAQGLWQFCIGWGITTTQKAMNRVQIASILLFFALLSMAYTTIFVLVQAGRI